MVQCQNCGRVNNYGSNFCRFCGTKFVINQVSPDDYFEQQQAPPPYSWKTDEFQIAEAPKPKQQQQQRQINQVQPLPFQYRQPMRPILPQQQFQQPHVFQNQPLPQQQYIGSAASCPRCAGQFVKQERKISTAGWIVFAVLLVTFFPLFWIGFLIKEDVKICQICNFKLT